MNLEQLFGWDLAGLTETLWQKLPKYHFTQHNSAYFDLESKPGRSVEKPTTNFLNQGMAVPDNIRRYKDVVVSSDMIFITDLYKIVIFMPIFYSGNK
jgi:hypothetical protein